jgi:ATP-binding cassette, subfamily B (MDR/TAP), member 1
MKVASKNNVPSQEHDDQFHTPGFGRSSARSSRRSHTSLFLFTCISSGAMTPVFSFLLSRLPFEVSTGAHNVYTINFFGAIVLGIAALDGLLMGFKYFIMETAGNAWVLRIRRQGFANVLAQDKKWFDKGENAGVRLIQTLVKDGDDARNLVALIKGQGVRL